MEHMLLCRLSMHCPVEREIVKGSMSTKCKVALESYYKCHCVTCAFSLRRSSQQSEVFIISSRALRTPSQGGKAHIFTLQWPICSRMVLHIITFFWRVSVLHKRGAFEMPRMNEAVNTKRPEGESISRNVCVTTRKIA